MHCDSLELSVSETYPDSSVFVNKLGLTTQTELDIHPFPEGNGRTQRVFLNHIAFALGYHFQWKKLHNWEIRETAIRYMETRDIKSTTFMLNRIIRGK